MGQPMKTDVHQVRMWAFGQTKNIIVIILFLGFSVRSIGKWPVRTKTKRVEVGA
jgi:hypothetical protein